MSIQRFIKAHEMDYPIALSEIKTGKKRSHWMWYIFPQIAGLGMSSTAQFYAISDIDEAKEYMADGTYDELIAKNGFFAELVEKQRIDCM